MSRTVSETSRTTAPGQFSWHDVLDSIRTGDRRPRSGVDAAMDVVRIAQPEPREPAKKG